MRRSAASLHAVLGQPPLPHGSKPPQQVERQVHCLVHHAALLSVHHGHAVHHGRVPADACNPLKPHLSCHTLAEPMRYIGFDDPVLEPGQLILVGQSFAVHGPLPNPWGVHVSEGKTIENGLLPLIHGGLHGITASKISSGTRMYSLWTASMASICSVPNSW